MAWHCPEPARCMTTSEIRGYSVNRDRLSDCLNLAFFGASNVSIFIRKHSR